jgi:GTPase
MARRLHSTAKKKDRAILVAADVRGTPLAARESLLELSELARTAGARVVATTKQKLPAPHPKTYVGSGKLEEIKSAVHQKNANVVICDDELTPSQQRQLEGTLDVKVLDRTALILDIFATRASSREGRLQVELAQMQYLAPRLRGQWQHLERMEGAIGLRGPGETQLETDRRLVSRRITKLKKDLATVHTQRTLYRRRRGRAGIPVVALVGYTNAGKSTLLRALSGADVLAEDRLFATLDPVTRRLRLPDDTTVLLTDTVGFIQKLPTQLVAAFRATLEELQEAALLLHVTDIAHPSASVHVETVQSTLAELGVKDTEAIHVLNKVDRLQNDESGTVSSFAEAKALLGPAPDDIVAISAAEGWGLQELLTKIARRIAAAQVNVIQPPPKLANIG